MFQNYHTCCSQNWVSFQLMHVASLLTAEAAWKVLYTRGRDSLYDTGARCVYQDVVRMHISWVTYATPEEALPGKVRPKLHFRMWYRTRQRQSRHSAKICLGQQPTLPYQYVSPSNYEALHSTTSHVVEELLRRIQ